MSKLSSWLITIILFSVFANIIFTPSVNSKKVIGSDIVTLYPIADSYVREFSPDTNYGNLTWLDIKCDSYDEYAYIMFNLSSLPPDAIIIEANLGLSLTHISGWGEFGVSIGIHRCSDNSWNETEITWTNKPDFAPDPTASRGFMGPVLVPSRYWWNVTVDVQTAFGLDQKLTEMIKFEQPQTDEGQATFRSREQETKPKLEIEYSTKPFYAVQFESIQDTGNTSNLGYLNFSSNFLNLPTGVLVVNGSYEANYIGGYEFIRWETEGGVSVSNPSTQKTNVTVNGPGKLSAVGSAEMMHYLYDDSSAEWRTYLSNDSMAAVRFTPWFVGTLEKARFFIDELSSYSDNTFVVHVMDANFSDIITPFSQIPSSTGWFEVDLSAYHIDVREDLFIAMEWLTDYSPKLGMDRSGPDMRSFKWNGTDWITLTYEDYMIRAVVQSELPIRQIGIISCTPLSSYVIGGRNVTVSGSITPLRIDTEVDITYIRPDGSTVIRKALTNSTGEYTDTFMPDRIGEWKVKASWTGDEDYQGSISFPEMFTVSKGTSSILLFVSYPSTITLGSSVNLTGGIWPQHFVMMSLEYSLDEGETWITFASVDTTSDGDYSHVWTPTSTGDYKVRASWEGDEICEGSTSSEDSVTVTETEETFRRYVDYRPFDITVKCNSTLSDFSFNETTIMISFQLTGISETVGYCNVSFPKELLGGPYRILINDSAPDTSSETSNDEMSLYFTFNFSSTCNVEIIGETVIPEFPNVVLPLFMVATLFAIILLKMKRNLKWFSLLN